MRKAATLKRYLVSGHSSAEGRPNVDLLELRTPYGHGAELKGPSPEAQDSLQGAHLYLY